MPETPEPVVEALRELDRLVTTAIERSEPLDRISIRTVVRSALASLTDEPRPTPVPQGLVERIEALADQAAERADWEQDTGVRFDGEQGGASAAGSRHHAMALVHRGYRDRLRAALDTQQEADRD